MHRYEIFYGVTVLLPVPVAVLNYVTPPPLIYVNWATIRVNLKCFSTVIMFARVDKKGKINVRKAPAMKKTVIHPTCWSVCFISMFHFFFLLSSFFPRFLFGFVCVPLAYSL